MKRDQTSCCTQPVDDEGTPCGRPTEFVFSKKLRDLGAGDRRYPYCSAHRRLRRIYGGKHKFSRRPIQEKEEE